MTQIFHLAQSILLLSFTAKLNFLCQQQNKKNNWDQFSSQLTFPRNLSSISLIISCHFSSILFLPIYTNIVLILYQQNMFNVYLLVIISGGSGKPKHEYSCYSLFAQILMIFFQSIVWNMEKSSNMAKNRHTMTKYTFFGFTLSTTTTTCQNRELSKIENRTILHYS